MAFAASPPAFWCYRLPLLRLNRNVLGFVHFHLGKVQLQHSVTARRCALFCVDPARKRDGAAVAPITLFFVFLLFLLGLDRQKAVVELNVDWTSSPPLCSVACCLRALPALHQRTSSGVRKPSLWHARTMP
jgi:hypothetical protein